MRFRFTILGAFAVFLAFIGVTPEDLYSYRASNGASSAAAPPTNAAVPGQVDASDPAADTLMVAIRPRPRALAELPTAREIAVDAALSELSAHVRESSHPHALHYAIEAYYNYKWANPDKVRKPYFYYVDFGLDSRTPRGYVFDMEKLSVVDGPFPVAHGRGSATGRFGVPTRFLNRNNSNATSLGLYLAQETYNFRGRSAGRSYRSVGLRLKGLSGTFNSAARARGIVVHGAPYVTATAAGRSEGCPAMELDRAQRLIPMIADGGLVFHFSPVDQRWMREDPWTSHLAKLALAD